jgi:transketolase N-terminal domain/subunit
MLDGPASFQPLPPKSRFSGVLPGHPHPRKLRNEPGIVAVIVGDGTLGEGMLYESMNLASIWQVPLLFVVENNGIAQTTPTASKKPFSIPLPKENRSRGI